MYRIDDTKNQIEKVTIGTFSALGYKERANLQEWIAKDPSVLGEDLLILAKEFAGFSETNERLDLLALDRDANLVLIENKLDDSGRDVVWQAQKYAAYCSGLTTGDIIELHQAYLNKTGCDVTAKDAICSFLEIDDIDEAALNVSNTQRIIMVAANFRKEVTATALWLMGFGLSVKCFKVTPYIAGDQRFLTFDQIIPVSDASDYMITMARKAHSEATAKSNADTTSKIRQRFWTQFIEKANERIDTYKNVSPSKDGWIGAGNGITNSSYNCVINQKNARVEVYMSRPVADENKLIFDALYSEREVIESTFGDALIWARLDGKKASRISYEVNGVNYTNEEDWPAITEFMVDAMERLVKAFTAPLARAREALIASWNS